MRTFSDLPFRTKLSVIVLITSTVPVLVLAAFLLTDKIISFRRNMLENISTLADVAGINSTAALSFDDPDTAREILTALKAAQDIVVAAILLPDGTLFSVYRNNESAIQIPDEAGFFNVIKPDFPQTPEGRWQGHRFSAQFLDVISPIYLNGKIIGYGFVRADLGPLKVRILWFVLLLLGLIILLFISIQIISQRLHKTIADPVTDLTRTMERVSEDQDYALRVQKTTGDEIGTLILGFNDMLAQIQKREEELAMHRDRLEEAVSERTKELEASHSRLKHEMEERIRIQEKLTRAQQMEAIGTLAAGVAHDLNNILSGIVSYPDLLLMNLPQDSPMRKPIETIQSSGMKAAAIIQDLLTLARRGVRTVEVLDLQKLVASYLQGPVHQKLLSFHPKISVETFFESRLPLMEGAPVQLEKALMNLVSNAAESMPEGGAIAIRLTHRYIDRAIPEYENLKEGDYLVLTVADTGIGIDDADKDRIFEPFYTKKKMGRSGTGLGMAVVWGTVKDHSGYIEVQNREGGGAEFHLYLPATRKAPPPIPSSNRPTSLPRCHGESILVIDDVREQREIASEILTSLGYRVETAASGEAALEYLKIHRVDLAVIDMIMDPGIDGLETYRRILRIHPEQRAILASGFSETERVKKAQQMGAGAYIRKPYTMEKIAEAVSTELGEN